MKKEGEQKLKSISVLVPLERVEASLAEIAWQLASLTPAMRAALRSLPPVGEDRSGPLGPGMLASGQLGALIRMIQRGIASS